MRLKRVMSIIVAVLCLCIIAEWINKPEPEDLGG